MFTIVTHNAMYDSMLSEQDDLPRCADEPLPVAPMRCSAGLTKRELLNGTAYGVRDTHVVVSGERDCAGFHEGMTEIIKQIRRILDTDTQADEILRKAASSPDSRVDRGVAGIIQLRDWNSTEIILTT